MQQKKLIVVAILAFALIIVGMFVFAFIKRSEIRSPRNVPPVDTSRTPTGPYDSITRIDAKHYYADNVHTLVGEILMPTPCDLLNWDTVVAESMPEQVTINFDVLNTSDVCAEVVTPARFKVEFQASEHASIRATLEGRTLELNLIPAPFGETPEQFELYIKG